MIIDNKRCLWDSVHHTMCDTETGMNLVETIVVLKYCVVWNLQYHGFCNSGDWVSIEGRKCGNEIYVDGQIETQHRIGFDLDEFYRLLNIDDRRKYLINYILDNSVLEYRGFVHDLAYFRRVGYDVDICVTLDELCVFSPLCEKANNSLGCIDNYLFDYYELLAMEEALIAQNICLYLDAIEPTLSARLKN